MTFFTGKIISMACKQWLSFPIAVKVGLGSGGALVANEAADTVGLGPGSLLRVIPGTPVVYSHDNKFVTAAVYKGQFVDAARLLCGDNTTYRGMSEQQLRRGFGANHDADFHRAIHASHSEPTHQGVSTSYDPMVAKQFARRVAKDACVAVFDATSNLRHGFAHNIHQEYMSGAELLTERKRALLTAYRKKLLQMKVDFQKQPALIDCTGGCVDRSIALKRFDLDIQLITNVLGGLPNKPSQAHESERELTLTHAVPDHTVIGSRSQWWVFNYGPFKYNELYIDHRTVEQAGCAKAFSQAEKELCDFLQKHTICKDNRAIVVVPREDVADLQVRVRNLYVIAARAGTGHNVDAIVEHYADRYPAELEQDSNLRNSTESEAIIAPSV